jgi:hypothetical protein
MTNTHRPNVRAALVTLALAATLTAPLAACTNGSQPGDTTINGQPTTPPTTSTAPPMNARNNNGDSGCGSNCTYDMPNHNENPAADDGS